MTKILEKLQSKFGENYSFKVLDIDTQELELKWLSNIEVICNIHHTKFTDLAINILHREYPCQNCERETEEKIEVKPKKNRNVEKLIRDFKEKHGEKFGYHDIEFSYKTMKEYVWIKCKTHNHWFQQSPNNHLNTKICCPKCLDELYNIKEGR